MRSDSPLLTVDAVIRERCDERRDGLVGKRRRRVDAAEAALRACFEAHGEAALTDDERRLLAVEQEFEAAGALARVAAADALLLVVPAFLLEPRWHGADRIDRRLRYLLGWRLAHRITRYPQLAGLDVTEALRAVDDAELVARRRMRRERQEELFREAERSGNADLQAVLRGAPRLPPPETDVDRDLPSLRRPFPARRRA